MKTKNEIIDEIEKQIIFAYDGCNWHRDVFLEGIKKAIQTIKNNDDLNEGENFVLSFIKGSPGYIELNENVPNTRTLIGTYNVPTGYYFVLDPYDKLCEAVFRPYTDGGIDDKYLISGVWEIMADTATESKERRELYTHLRTPIKPDEYLVLVAGDKIKIYFTADKKLSVENTTLFFPLKVFRRRFQQLSCQNCIANKLIERFEEVLVKLEESVESKIEEQKSGGELDMEENTSNPF